MTRRHKVEGHRLAMLEKVYESYGTVEARIVEIHSQDSPWASARRAIAPEARCDAIISKDEIRDWYGEAIGKAWR